MDASMLTIVFIRNVSSSIPSQSSSISLTTPPPVAPTITEDTYTALSKPSNKPGAFDDSLYSSIANDDAFGKILWAQPLPSSPSPTSIISFPPPTLSIILLISISYSIILLLSNSYPIIFILRCVSVGTPKGNQSPMRGKGGFGDHQVRGSVGNCG
ncbi:hypothetical protein QCA50_002595 [Cerrena zonata]|uniref:Uncharacterized protein n=1 Tax=Cerrena zonata TaxID=2478898 RepID=A0AAW0GIB9_9APHY